MSKFIPLLCLALSLAGSPSYAQVNLVCSGTQSFYSVVAGPTADSVRILAAGKLQEYLSEITGCTINLCNQADGRLRSFFIGREWIKDTATVHAIENLDSEGYAILTRNGDFYLAGKNPAGDVYAVYAFLEQAGCLWFSATETYIPKINPLTIPDINRFDQPDFRFRLAHFPDRDSPAWYLPNRTSTMNDWGLFVHTFKTLCPPSIYFDQHPDYFSLVNGKRIRDGQLCMSNPAVIALLAGNLKKEMDKKPDCRYWSVSQNDCYNYCECDQCQALYKKYGSISGAYVAMANQLARQFPGKQISTLAYQFTRSAPTAIVPDSNVNIMFCSIECNRSLPLEADPRSNGFVKDMQDWARLTHNIFMWDYVVQFKTYTCPFPNFDVLQPNIQFFKKYGIPMMFQQGSGDSWSDLCEYKQALIARLLWDSNLDEPVFRNAFFNAFYGAAAPVMLNYFSKTLAGKEMQSAERSLDIYGYPVLYADWFLKPELLGQYKAMMDEAEQCVAGDPVRLARVLRQRCSPDFACLDVALNLNDPGFSFYRENEGRLQINPEMLEYLERFTANCASAGIRSIDESGYSPAQYREQVLNTVRMATLENKAKGKNLKSLTSYSPLYDVGGVKALTDGRFGGRHFRLNWLGYQGTDLEVLIDFGEPVSCSTLETNFFLDLVSWIFLPTGIRIDRSDDGEIFTQVYSQQIADPEQSTGQKPVHFSFRFPLTTSRYLKFTAFNRKVCPAWHRGAGQPAWIFTDELIVR